MTWLFGLVVYPVFFGGVGRSAEAAPPPGAVGRGTEAAPPPGAVFLALAVFAFFNVPVAFLLRAGAPGWLGTCGALGACSSDA